MSAHKITCRTCESPEGTLVSLFEEFGEGLTFAEALTACVPVEFSSTDNLPKHICFKCSASLIAAYHFQRQCIEIYHKLLNSVLKSEETNVKSEPCEEAPFKEDCDGDNFFQDFISDIGISNKSGSKNEIVLPESTEVKEEFVVTGSEFKTKKIFTCGTCNTGFYKKTLLDNHNAAGKCRKCESRECGNKLSVENALGKPVDIRHDPKYDIHCKGELLSFYQCHMCSAKFKRKGNLINHIATYDHSHKCKDCGKIFNRLTELKCHEKVHKNENATTKIKKPHTCPYCEKVFRQSSNLREHLNVHTGEKTFLCSECGRGYSCKTNLRQHLLRHTGEKPFACHLCPKKFTLKATMQAHVATHTGERRHTCDACGKRYSTRWTLKKHALLHAGAPRPHQCDRCEKTFTKREHLKRHYRIHTGEKPYVCSMCSRAFVQSNDLNKHIARHLGHPDIYECEKCPERFRLKADLIKHSTMHYLKMSTMSSSPTGAKCQTNRTSESTTGDSKSADQREYVDNT